MIRPTASGIGGFSGIALCGAFAFWIYCLAQSGRFPNPYKPQSGPTVNLDDDFRSEEVVPARVRHRILDLEFQLARVRERLDSLEASPE